MKPGEATMTDYKKEWEDSVKYAHKLELENAKLKRQFDAELNAVKNDYARYKQLEKQTSHLKAILEVLNTNNEIASLHDRELWSLHGELQKTINESIA